MRWLATLAMLCAVTAIFAWPDLAAACPSCAAANTDDTFFWILGTMILLPYPAAGIVIYMVKRGEEDEHHDE